MATLLDAGILEHFGAVFVAILLFAIIYGLLEATKPFGGDKKGLHSLIALFIALLLLVSRVATSMIKVMVPWFIVIMVFIFFVMLLFRMFGVDDKQFLKVISEASVYPWIIIFALLVLFGSLGAVFGQSLLEAGGGGPAPVVVGPNQPTPEGGTLLPDAAYAESGGSTNTDSFAVNLMNTLRNPKVLGLVFIFLTGAFLMIFLTKSAT